MHLVFGTQILNFELQKLTFWTNIFTVSSHPSIVTNAVAIILTASGKVFAFADLVAILTEIPGIKPRF